MEKLFQILIFFSCCQFAIAQESLCVFSSAGSNYIETGSIRKLAKKGDLISKKDKLVMSSGNIIAIDNNGNTYTIAKPGTFAFKKLLAFRQKSTNNAITGKYFKLVWNELTGNTVKQKIIGGVFRGEVLMELPKDSSKVLETKAALRWKPAEGKSVFIFIRNKTTDEILKLESDGSQLTLFGDNPIFDEGKEFEWTVSEREFVNLKNVVFYSFSFIDKKTYDEHEKKYSDFVAELRNLNISRPQIDQILCETYKFCR